MSYRCFDLEIENGIAHLRLKRGDTLNTMVPEFWRELPEIVWDIDRKAKARVIVISSTGKHFSAGMDLAVFTEGQSIGTSAAASKEERGRVRANLRQAVLDIQESFNVLERARLPVLAAIQGGCVGGGAGACPCALSAIATIAMNAIITVVLRITNRETIQHIYLSRPPPAVTPAMRSGCRFANG